MASEENFKNLMLLFITGKEWQAEKHTQTWVVDELQPLRQRTWVIVDEPLKTAAQLEERRLGRNHREKN